MQSLLQALINCNGLLIVPPAGLQEKMQDAEFAARLPAATNEASLGLVEGAAHLKMCAQHLEIQTSVTLMLAQERNSSSTGVFGPAGRRYAPWNVSSRLHTQNLIFENHLSRSFCGDVSLGLGGAVHLEI